VRWEDSANNTVSVLEFLGLRKPDQRFFVKIAIRSIPAIRLMLIVPFCTVSRINFL
jgi:hypothetical protein